MFRVLPEITGIAWNDTAMARAWRTLSATAVLLTIGCGAPPAPIETPRLSLAPCVVGGTEASCGALTVFENRSTRTGRTIGLNIVVLRARGQAPAADAIFYLAGGPGQGATTLVNSGLVDRSLQETRDLVFVDQRGTGGSNPLDCDLPGSPSDPQSYLDEVFQVGLFEKCRDRLAATADVKLYTTPNAADDLDDVRASLGYPRINLMGGSYGTRMGLTYMRRHPTHVRSAVLNGVAPPSLRNPLYHARAAQEALDRLFDECAADAACQAAFPRLREEFQSVLARLEREPARVSVRAEADTPAVPARLSRYAFAETIRMMMYRVEGTRLVPFAVHAAYRGDFSIVVQRAVAQRRSNERLAHGMLLSTTCSEDVIRIRDEEIPEVTAGTFFGKDRVVQQKRVCGIWPQDAVPAEGGAPVPSEAPVLLLSGTLDPVTPPRWADEALKSLPNGRHVVLPGAHGVGGPCVTQMVRDFVAAGSAKNLATDCVAGVSLPPFAK